MDLLAQNIYGHFSEQPNSLILTRRPPKLAHSLVKTSGGVSRRKMFLLLALLSGSFARLNAFGPVCPLARVSFGWLTGLGVGRVCSQRACLLSLKAGLWVNAPSTYYKQSALVVTRLVKQTNYEIIFACYHYCWLPP